jgi:hypothetical protein
MNTTLDAGHYVASTVHANELEHTSIVVVSSGVIGVPSLVPVSYTTALNCQSLVLFICVHGERMTSQTVKPYYHGRLADLEVVSATFIASAVTTEPWVNANLASTSEFKGFRSYALLIRK